MNFPCAGAGEESKSWVGRAVSPCASSAPPPASRNPLLAGRLKNSCATSTWNAVRKPAQLIGRGAAPDSFDAPLAGTRWSARRRPTVIQPLTGTYATASISIRRFGSESGATMVERAGNGSEKYSR
jgi:hypothetical protein